MAKEKPKQAVAKGWGWWEQTGAVLEALRGEILLKSRVCFISLRVHA